MRNRAKSEFPAGKNPNSHKNLENGNRNKQQNFYTRVASMLNWEARAFKAVEGKTQCSQAAAYAQQYSPNWNTFSEERKAAIVAYEQSLYDLNAAVVKTLQLLEAIPKTELRTPQARQDRLKRRREARRLLPLPF